jgi:hypothetical protein
MKINTKTQKSVADAYEAYNAKSAAMDSTKMITESWAPMIERTTNVKDPEKLAWMSQLAHNTAKQLNEDAAQMPANAYAQFGGVYSPYNTLYNTLGVGDAVPAGKPAMTGADFANDRINGSGDKYPALLPLALKIAAKTIGFELVNTTPLAGPTGVLPYMDYVYSGSKQPFGATPAWSADTANPGQFNQTRPNDFGNRAFSLFGLPHAFKAELVPATGSNADSNNKSVMAIKKTLFEAAKAAEVTLTGQPVVVKEGDVEVLKAEFIGWSRIDGEPMLKVVDGKKALGDIFMSGKAEAELLGVKLTLARPELISMNEDTLQGFAGAGPLDRDAWMGTYQDGTVLYDPMSRGVGEMTAPRQISLQLFTKNVTVGTIQVGCAVTQEQVTDLQKQWNIDVVKIVENAGVNELSQTINRHITSRLFALGWKNMCKLVEVEGPEANLNISFSTEKRMTPAFAIPEGVFADNAVDYTSYRNQALPFRPLALNPQAHFENRDTLIKRIFTNILAASNWIQ